jgi:NADH-quinone oxidoreductase subunit B
MENLRNNQYQLKLFGKSFAETLKPFLIGSGPSVAEFKVILSSKFYFTPYDIQILNEEPENCDVMIICGSITKKMVPYLVECFERMLEPKWTIWIGSVDGKKSFYDSVSLVEDLSEYIPIDFYIDELDPLPEQIMDTLIHLKEKIAHG